MTKLKALFLIATLKTENVLSHTQVLSEFLAEHFKAYDVESSFIRLIHYDIRPGVYTKINHDDWPQIYHQLLDADIIIFATPVWWNNQSSLLQRVIERLDEVHDDLMKTGRSAFANKVAGVVVTGDSDGAMHIMGNLSNFCQWIGMTITPLGTLTVLSYELRKESKITREKLWNFYQEQYSTYAKATAQNISFMAKLLKANPLPDKLLP